MPGERLEERAAAVEAGELAALVRAIEASRRRVSAWTLVERRDAAPRPERTSYLPSAERGTGCVICDRLLRALFDFMAREQLELATRIEKRMAHAAAGGYCPVHTWYYAEIASPVGISASYARLGESVAALLSTAADTDDLDALREAMRASQAGPERCPACRRLAEAREGIVVELRASLVGGHTVPPLCLGHAGDLLEGESDLEVARAVVRATANRLSRRAEDMRTYSLKRGALRRALIDREEEVAHRDVLVRLVGDSLLVGGPRPQSSYASPFRSSARAGAQGRPR